MVGVGACPMQAVAEKSAIFTSPKVIVFPKHMGAPNPIPPPQTEQPSGFHAPTHGNWAQWAAIAAAIIIPFIVRHYDRTAMQDAENFNLRVDSRIDAKLNPKVDKINEHIDSKVDELGKKIDALSDRVSRIEGQLGNRVSSLEHRADQQISLARIMDPNRTLGTIRAELQMARASGKLLSVSDLEDYRNAVQALPISAREYWTTAAAIINYQSLLNQMSDEAPDPTKVSTPCLGMTTQNGVLSQNNMFRNFSIPNCVVDLDTLHFIRVTFINSVIR